MSGPFRSQAPFLEARLRELEREAEALVETAAELAHEGGLRRRPSQLVFLATLIAVFGSVGGVIAGRLGEEKRAKARSYQLAERASAQAATVRQDKEACQSTRDSVTDSLDVCEANRTVALRGGPEVFAPGDHGLDARLAFFRIAAAVDVCLVGVPEPLVAFVTFANDGAPVEVELEPSRMTAARRECTEKAIRGTRMDPFTGEPVHARATFTSDFIALRAAIRSGR